MTTISSPSGAVFQFGNVDVVENEIGPMRDWVEPHLQHVDRWDMGWLLARYVHADLPANRNGHIFALEDLKSAYKLIPHTPLNMLHRQTHVIGAQVAAELLWPTDGTSMALGEPSTPWVETLSSVWRVPFADEYRAIKENVKRGSASVSMECWPKTVTCEKCKATYPFAGITSDTYTCGHLADRRAPKWLNEPHFVASGVVLPPAEPGWKDAAIQQVAAFADADPVEAERIYSEVARQMPHMSPREWEATMGAFLVAAGVVTDVKKKKRYTYRAEEVAKEADPFGLDAAKLPHTAVNYRSAVHMTVSCSTCEHFQAATGTCELVEDPIDPLGLCDLWLAAPDKAATAVEGPRGAMIAIYPPETIAADLAELGTEPADQIHVTLLFLGKAADLPYSQADVVGVVEQVAAVTAPITATVNGLGRFALEDGNEATFAQVDAPGLCELHTRLAGGMEAAGFSFATNHGFIPHATLAYHRAGEGPTVMPPPVEWTVGEVHVVWEGAQHPVPLQGVETAMWLTDEEWVAYAEACGFDPGVTDRSFSTEKRKEAAKKGHAMPDGSFPIENEADLRNAINLAGNAKNPAAARAHIKKRARALGREDLIPEGWK